MKNKIVLLTFVLTFILSSCGKNYSVESGSVSSDKSIISNGIFSESHIVTDSIYEDFYCTDGTYKTDTFCYLIKNYSGNSLKLISFTNDGSGFSDISLNLPFSMIGLNITSDSYSDLLNTDGAEGLSLFYYDPYFGKDGNIEGYCCINGVKYFISAPTVYFTDYYFISWNIDGSLKSVESVEPTDDEKNDLIYHKYYSYDNEGNLLTITDSGIVRSDGKDYIDTYFDAVNSSYSGTLDKIIFADDDHFSAVTSQYNTPATFSVFSRENNELINITPISLYCSELSEEIKNKIFEYNKSADNYRIGVRNYSDIHRDYSEDYIDSDALNSAAFAGLKEDILSGDIPDIIYESAGCDNVFLTQLSDKGLVMDLKEGIKTDQALKGNKYLENLYDLSSEEGIFRIIPSFTYDTYVSPSSNEELSAASDLDAYISYRSLNNPELIIMDSYSSGDLLLKALAFNGSSWIDISNKSVSFGDDYKKYLELASKLPETKDEYSLLSQEGSISSDIQLFYTPVGNIGRDYFISWRKFYDEPVNVGFPSNTGAGTVFHPTGSLMICSDRSSAPGCWDFARSFITKEYQDTLEYSIPVLESSFDIWKSRIVYDTFTESDLIMLYDGPVTVPQISSENAEALSNAILSSDRMYFTDPDIEEIVLRNAGQYFDGKITADEAAEATKKEILTYLGTI